MSLTNEQVAGIVNIIVNNVQHSLSHISPIISLTSLKEEQVDAFKPYQKAVDLEIKTFLGEDYNEFDVLDVLLALVNKVCAHIAEAQNTIHNTNMLVGSDVKSFILEKTQGVENLKRVAKSTQNLLGGLNADEQALTQQMGMLEAFSIAFFDGSQFPEALISSNSDLQGTFVTSGNTAQGVVQDQMFEIIQSLNNNVFQIADFQVSILKTHSRIIDCTQQLFDVKLSTRSNPLPFALPAIPFLAKAVGISGSIALGVFTTNYAYNTYVANVKNAEADRALKCARMTKAIQDAQESVKELFETTVKKAQFFNLKIVLTSLLDKKQNFSKLKHEGVKYTSCVEAQVQYLDCLNRTLPKTQNEINDLTDNKIIPMLITIAGCLSANIEFLKDSIKSSEDLAQRLRDESGFNREQERAKLVNNLLTYAGYSAVSLSILWGISKVYKAYKE